MITKRPKVRENSVSSLNAAIETMNLAEKVSSITPAKAVFATVSVLLVMIKVCFLPFHNEMFQVHA